MERPERRGVRRRILSWLDPDRDRIERRLAGLEEAAAGVLHFKTMPRWRRVLAVAAPFVGGGFPIAVQQLGMAWSIATGATIAIGGIAYACYPMVKHKLAYFVFALIVIACVATSPLHVLSFLNLPAKRPLLTVPGITRFPEVAENGTKAFGLVFDEKNEGERRACKIAHIMGLTQFGLPDLFRRVHEMIDSDELTSANCIEPGGRTRHFLHGAQLGDRGNAADYVYIFTHYCDSERGDACCYAREDWAKIRIDRQVLSRMTKKDKKVLEPEVRRVFGDTDSMIRALGRGHLRNCSP